jgi:hypothetical protein
MFSVPTPNKINQEAGETIYGKFISLDCNNDYLI